MAKAMTIETGAWVGRVDDGVLFEGRVERTYRDELGFGRAVVRWGRRAGANVEGQYNLHDVAADTLTRFA